MWLSMLTVGKAVAKREGGNFFSRQVADLKIRAQESFQGSLKLVASSVRILNELTSLTLYCLFCSSRNELASISD